MSMMVTRPQLFGNDWVPTDLRAAYLLKRQRAAAARLEGPVLPAGVRGVRVRAGRCQAGQESARAAEAGSV